MTSAAEELPPSMIPSQGTETKSPMAFKNIKYEMGGEGHKFGLPEAPLARTDHFRRRYDPVVEQLTKALMRHGKLGAAQRVCPSSAGI
jgi:hypothetical protein